MTSWGEALNQWNWHEFEVDDSSSEPDELDDYFDFNQGDPEEFVTREFWVGSASDGYLYVIAFNRVYGDGLIKTYLGDAKFNDEPVSLPESGAWIVTFGLADSENYDHVQLNPRQQRDLVTGVACALYDHYNVSKSGLYFWKAAREELKGAYDSALGFGRVVPPKIKFIPLTNNLNGLGDQRRGYAIITKYY